MRNQTLGVDIDRTVIVHSPNVTDSTYEQKFAIFKQKVSQRSEVVSVCGSSAVPGGQPDWNAGGIRTLSQREDESNQYRVIMMDGSFIKGFGLNVIAGRGFSDEVSNEQKSVMLNESGARLMGFKKPKMQSTTRSIFGAIHSRSSVFSKTTIRSR